MPFQDHFFSIFGGLDPLRVWGVWTLSTTLKREGSTYLQFKGST